MAAIIKNLTINTTGIEDTSKRYRTNITNIYKHINDMPYTDKDEIEISQYIREVFQRITDKKQITERLNTVKNGMVNFKESKAAIKGMELLNTGKAKLIDTRLQNMCAKDLKLKFIKRFNTISSNLLKSRYFNMISKKQQ
jgi:hypothetical protein